MSVNPYAYALEGRDPATVIAETPARLEMLVAKLSTAELEAKPAPDKWSVREVLVHQRPQPLDGVEMRAV